MYSVPVNYAAIIGAVLAMMALGFVWYGPLFGKKWAHLSGLSMDAMKMNAKTMLIMAASTFVMAYVLQHSLVFASSYTHVMGTSGGVMAGFWSWLGFIAPVLLGTVLWEKKSWTLYAINSGYYLVGLCLMGAILGYWQ